MALHMEQMAHTYLQAITHSAKIITGSIIRARIRLETVTGTFVAVEMA